MMPDDEPMDENEGNKNNDFWYDDSDVDPFSDEGFNPCFEDEVDPIVNQPQEHPEEVEDAPQVIQAMVLPPDVRCPEAYN